MPAIATRRRPAATKPVPAKKKGGGGAVVVAGIVGAGLLASWWFLFRRRGGGPPTPPPANPVVNVGDDKAVTLDATAHAAITINFSVTGPNPVNLAWTSSGPAPVSFSPLGPNQEQAAFQTPGNYLLRLTATDTTDSRAQGFDELAVIVNELLLAAILVPGELKIDGFAIFTLTRNVGETLSLVWPVQNVGELAGAAFIQVTEAGVEVGTGAPFPINPGQTVAVNFNPIVSLDLGVHILAARVMEGLPPDGVPVGSAQIITLTVTSVPVLSAVGLPTINGVLAPTVVNVIGGQFVSMTWACQNSGGGAGLVRLRLDRGTGFLGDTGLITIPGFSTEILLLAVKTLALRFTITVVLRMRDEADVLLGEWPFVLNGL